MTRSNKEIAEEVLRRVEAIDRRKAVRKQRIRGALAIIAALALTVGAGFAIAAFAPDSPSSVMTEYNLMFPNAGGYVLMAVIGFSLGAAAMFICLRRQAGDE